jgi:hypothetical protein
MRRLWATAATAILAFGMCGFLLAACSSTTDDSSTTGLLTDEVYDTCNKFVERRLAHPGSSSFQGIDEAEITVDGNRGTDVSYVDAANAFGSTSRRPFTCTIRSSGDTYHLVNLDIDLSA